MALANRLHREFNFLLRYEPREEHLVLVDSQRFPVQSLFYHHHTIYLKCELKRLLIQLVHNWEKAYLSFQLPLKALLLLLIFPKLACRANLELFAKIDNGGACNKSCLLFLKHIYEQVDLTFATA